MFFNNMLDMRGRRVTVSAGAGAVREARAYGVGLSTGPMSVWFRRVAVARRGATVASHPPRLDACRLRLRRSSQFR